MSDTNGKGKARSGLLTGVKVVEFAQIVAGPLAGGMLADQGADVVHVETTGRGDPARVMGPPKDGVHLWWKVSGRNKRSVTLDLHTTEGQELAHKLVVWADIAIIALRPSTLRGWNMDWPSLRKVNPKLILLQISGYGATSTLADSPGLGKMGEARSGVVYVTGDPEGPPIHTGFSHADTITGLMGSFGVLAALHRRETDPDFAGEWIDLALFEPLFRLIEWQVIVNDQLGMVPERAGNRLSVAPAAVVNTYMSADGDWLTVTTATPRSVDNVVAMVGLTNEEFQSLGDVKVRGDKLDKMVGEWVAARTTEVALTELAELGVVASPIFSIADIMEDQTYAEREDIITITDHELGPVKMQAVIPHTHEYPGQVWRTGAALGEDNDLVYGEWLGLSREARQSLREHQTI